MIQRTTRARVLVEGETVGEVNGPGLVVLVGITHDDDEAKAKALAEKIAQLRIMRGERSVLDVGAEVLAISQFTLYADTRKGRRPSWSAAAPGAVAEPLYEKFCAELENLGLTVARGRFGADMAVELTNDGPITLTLEM